MASKRSINETAGTIAVYELLPNAGDALTVTNRGTHYEIRYHQFELPPLKLTDEDIESILGGSIVWH